MEYAVIKFMRGRKLIETSTLAGNREAINKRFHELSTDLSYRSNEYYKFVNPNDHKLYEAWVKENRQF